MPRKHDDKSYYDSLRQRLLNFRPVAWLVLVAVVSLGVIKYYNELTTAIGQAWKETGIVRFTTTHAPLLERGKVEIQQDSHAVSVAGFDAPLKIARGSYSAAAHIDNRVLLRQPFMVQAPQNDVDFHAQFAVTGVVVNGQGRPLANIVVRINGRRARTGNDGQFVLDDLPMQRTYDIQAWPASGGGGFSAQRPWTGTVYNGNWDTTVIQNIALVRSP